MAVRFRLSEETDRRVTILQTSFNFNDRPPILRLGLALALAHPTLDLTEKDSAGPEIPLSAVVKDDELLLHAMITQKLGRGLEPSERRRAYKQLVDFGVGLLWSKFEDEKDPETLLLQLSDSLEGSVDD